jgi:hypothetical protein
MSPALHNIHFAALGPAHGIGIFAPVVSGFSYIGAEGPNSGPNAASGGEFRAYINAPIGKCKFGIQPSRCIIFSAVLVGIAFFFENNFETSIADVRIVEFVSVVLDFSIKPRTVIGSNYLMVPIFGLGIAVVIKLIGPY